MQLLSVLSCFSAFFACVPASAWVAPARSDVLRRITTSLRALAAPATGVYTLDGEEIRGPITPVGNFILVRVKDTLTATSGGILLPDQSKQRATEGLVIAAGPGKVHPFTAVRIHNPIKEGMSVLYGQFDGKAVTYNDDACQLLRDDDCLLYYEGVTMKLDNVFPVRDYVLIELDDDPETLSTSSGVVIASQVMADTLPCEGTVVKVGEGRMASTGEFTKPQVAAGDRVKFRDYAGNEVKIEGKDYTVVKMVDILGSLKESA
jgi:chaperonin GroES